MQDKQIVFWNDQQNTIPNHLLFSDIADKRAEIISKYDKKFNNYSQIRKFYDEVIRINTLAKHEKWEHILPMVHMLNAKAAYAKGRKLITDEFLDDIKSCVKQVNQIKDLQLFANYFEAFMGYYKSYRPKD